MASSTKQRLLVMMYSFIYFQTRLVFRQNLLITKIYSGIIGDQKRAGPSPQDQLQNRFPCVEVSKPRVPVITCSLIRISAWARPIILHKSTQLWWDPSNIYQPFKNNVQIYIYYNSNNCSYTHIFNTPGKSPCFSYIQRVHKLWSKPEIE